LSKVRVTVGSCLTRFAVGSASRVRFGAGGVEGKVWP